jgi:hypothetical protein
MPSAGPFPVPRCPILWGGGHNAWKSAARRLLHRRSYAGVSVKTFLRDRADAQVARQRHLSIKTAQMLIDAGPEGALSPPLMDLTGEAVSSIKRVTFPALIARPAKHAGVRQEGRGDRYL